MSANDEVVKYLNYYLSSELEADFAVMLNGPWGAGKTHFVKTFFKEREERAKSEDPLHPLGHLYASLFGVRSTSEITDQFFAQAHPVLNSKAARLLGTAFSRALNVFAGTDVNSDKENKSVIQDMVLNLDGRVLVFDDLERCTMPLVDVMGFINAFVEHDGLKVIVIANEEDIPEDQKPVYARRKEKLIGKTLRVTSEPEAVLDSLVGKLTNPTVIDTIKLETGPLLRTFVASRKHNLRSLKSRVVRLRAPGFGVRSAPAGRAPGDDQTPPFHDGDRARIPQRRSHRRRNRRPSQHDALQNDQPHDQEGKDARHSEGGRAGSDLFGR